MFEFKADGPGFDENTDFYGELVGDGKKFKDEKALAKGKFESDLYIKTLEQKLDEIRSDYEEARKQNMAGARLEELIDRLSKTDSNSDNTPNAKDEENPKFNPEDIENLVSKKLAEAKILEKEQVNFARVQDKLKERYGNNFTNVIEQQKQILGLDDNDIKLLARKSPDAFFRVLQLDQKQDSFQAPPRSQMRNDNFHPNVEKRTWAWYQKLKQKDLAAYHAPKTIAQMHRDHAELGREFEDGNFHD